MAKRQPNGITAEIERLLSVAVAPMTVGQIREALEMKYEAGEVSAVLVKMVRARKVMTLTVPRTSVKGRAVVQAFVSSREFGADIR